jgi:hypothetical protein
MAKTIKDKFKLALAQLNPARFARARPMSAPT